MAAGVRRTPVPCRSCGIPLPSRWGMVAGSRCRQALNGPAGSGQGGYWCGLVAALIGNPAEVTLRDPVPLGRGSVERAEGRRGDRDQPCRRAGGEAGRRGPAGEAGQTSTLERRVGAARSSRATTSEMEAFAHASSAGRGGDGERGLPAARGWRRSRLRARRPARLDSERPERLAGRSRDDDRVASPSSSGRSARLPDLLREARSGARAWWRLLGRLTAALRVAAGRGWSELARR